MALEEHAERIAQLEADNARLRRLLDGRNAPGELRHRQRNTLALLRNVIRESAVTGTDLETYVAHLQDRLDTIGRVHDKTDVFGEVDLYGLVADELLAYAVRADDQAVLSGPGIRLQPNAAHSIGIALHELAVNAIEHGVLSDRDARLSVTWTLSANGAETPSLTLLWKETGRSSSNAPARRGFGTQVLDEMLSYALKAKTDLAFEPDGLRCTIVLPFPPQVGRVDEVEDGFDE